MTESQEGWSPYHYVYANPVLRTDPDGRCPDGDCPEVSVAGIVENTVKDLAVSAMNVAFMVEPPMRVLEQGGNTRAYRDENGSIQVGVRPLATNGKEFLGNMGSDLLDGANVASTVATGGAGGGGLLMAKTGAKAVIANSLVQSGKKAVTKYEVGTFDELQVRSVKGDDLAIHHSIQGQPAKSLIPGYDYKKAPAIAIPTREHNLIPTLKGTNTAGNPRQQLAKDIKDMRKNTNVPSSNLLNLINLNKEMYPILRYKQVSN